MLKAIYNKHRLIRCPQNREYSHFVRIIRGAELNVKLNFGVNKVTSLAICLN